ncbi:hypothetical protein BJX70DRAFT_279461 [Aspergillus crustosus]
MAGTATATYSSDLWTSASTIDANEQQWGYSVPVNQENNRRRSKSRTSSLSKQAYTHEQSHHASRGRPDATASRKQSENAGVQDTTITPQINGLTGKTELKDANGVPIEKYDEKWIHRDKLARIESEELQQAAILFHRRPGTGSTRTGRGRSRDQHGSVSGTTATTPAPTEPLEPWPDFQEDQRNFAVSSVPAEGDDVIEQERHNWDLRRPEEIAADLEKSASQIYRNPGLRKSSSRIPIPKTSPAPLSPDQIDREFVLPRSRATSNEEENSLSLEMSRRASEPMTVDSASTSSPASDSRPGSQGAQSQNTAAKKTPAKTSPTNRKASATTPKKPTPRSRATSSNNNNQRPTTRSGENRPPTAVNRPEGDPPWLATMYKPDPRLPPDQQILPTHARRLQQEQWEKEGKTPTAYDREFAPLAIAPELPRPEDKAEKESEKESQQSELLKTDGLGLHALSKSPEPGTRPGTSTGYSPMPKLQDTPPTGLTPRFNSQTVVTAQGPPPDDKVDKGCGCCIVM